MIQKLQKWQFWNKKGSFSTKNTCKINISGPRDTKLGLKLFPKYPLCDEDVSKHVIFDPLRYFGPL